MFCYFAFFPVYVLHTIQQFRNIIIRALLVSKISDMQLCKDHMISLTLSRTEFRRHNHASISALSTSAKLSMISLTLSANLSEKILAYVSLSLQML